MERSAGTSTSGRVLRGAIASSLGPIRSASSIPAKYETILNSGQREQKAFGTSASRFTGKSSDENPGPDAYTSNNPEGKSFSNRGYGGSATKCCRWFNEPPPSFNPPGPGQYNPPAAINVGRSPSFGRRRKKRNLFFKPRVKESPLLTEAEQMRLVSRRGAPGPGEYDVTKSSDERKGVPSSSSFRSGTSRDPSFRKLLLSRSPGPGQYDLADSGEHTEQEKRIPSAAFQSTSQQRPTTITIGAPGPGSYETDKVDFDRSHLPPRRPGLKSSVSVESPMFKACANRRRVPGDDHGIVGPGSYYNIGEMDKEYVSSSFFVSGRPRFDWEGYSPSVRIQPPGPAYYNPGVASKKKSFHLNAKNEWTS